jgi:serine/threonine protein phosphatase PrpC
MTEAKMMMFATVLHLCKDGGKSIEQSFPFYYLNKFSVDMEDAHATILKLDDNRWSHWSYFGIFDGHAGYRTAVKAAEKLHLRIVPSLNTLIQDNANGKSSSQITSSQLDFHKLEMGIKDAYFKFDSEWRDELRTNNPGIKNQ